MSAAPTGSMKMSGIRIHTSISAVSYTHLYLEVIVVNDDYEVVELAVACPHGCLPDLSLLNPVSYTHLLTAGY